MTRRDHKRELTRHDRVVQRHLEIFDVGLGGELVEVNGLLDVSR
jgi:hypothetical protein